MADEPRYSDEIRIPISMTLPWSGKLTLGGKPWPQDARGRDWPEGRDGQPEFPIDLLPVGFAPGTNEIYHTADEREKRRAHLGATGSVTVTAEAPLTAETLVTVAVEGVEALITLAALPEFLAGVAIGASVAMLIGTARYWFVNSPTAQGWARNLPGRKPHAEAFPVAPPIPPLPPMVAGPDLPGHTGSDNTVRLPAIPTGSPPATLPTIQPGAEIVEPGPFILESRRNDGLEGDERTNTDRARQAARRGDPEVTAILSDSEWRAHHLIPMELIRKGHSVLRGAARAGFKTDEDANVAAVPNSLAAQEKLRRAGINRPVDDSGHPA